MMTKRINNNMKTEGDFMEFIEFLAPPNLMELSESELTKFSTTYEVKVIFGALLISNIKKEK